MLSQSFTIVISAHSWPGFSAFGSKSESRGDGFSIGVKYVFKRWSYKSSLSYFTASFSVFLTILTIPGNFLVCLAIINDPFRNFKTPFNYFLMSLAATDLVVGTMMDPVSVALQTSEALQLDFLNSKVARILYFIKILHILYFILCTASILTLMALTVDRYMAVSSPVKYKNNVTFKWAIATSIPFRWQRWSFPFLYFELGFIFYSFIFEKRCCSQHVWGSHLCSCRNT